MIEQFPLLLCCVGSATYRWAGERSGAADQNLQNLKCRTRQRTRPDRHHRDTPPHENVLAPVVDLVVDRVETTTNPPHNISRQHHQPTTTLDGGNNNNNDNKSGQERQTVVKQNFFTQKEVDPHFRDTLRLTILCRTAPLVRQVVLSNFHKLDQCIGDYLQAQAKDGQHDRNGGLAY